MTTFAELNFKTTRNGGVQAHAFFPNGYGASVMRDAMSYGGSAGLYELAVLKGAADCCEITYATPVTDDVRGHLSPSDVTRLLGEIAALPTPKT